MARVYLNRVEKVRIKMDFTKNLRVRGRQLFGFELLMLKKGRLCKVSSVPRHA